MAKKVLLLAQRNRRLVSFKLLRSFCGVCVSLSLAYSPARFYTRSLYSNMGAAERVELQKMFTGSAAGLACEAQALPRGPFTPHRSPGYAAFGS